MSKCSFSQSLLFNASLPLTLCSYCCSEFPNSQILHPLLDLPLYPWQNIYCLWPQEGLFPLYISCLLLVLCVSMLYCSYLDCSRWEGLWPALNLTKIKQPASWIIYIFKSLPLLFIAHSLHQISPSRPPPVTGQSPFSLVLLSHWHILRYVNLSLNILIFL